MSQAKPHESHLITGAEKPWLKFVLVGVAILYVGGLILFPFGGLFVNAVSKGLGTFRAIFDDPNAIAAISLSIQVAIVATIVNSIFGVIVSWVLVRTEFPGKRFVDALINLPFALSPVIIGYLLILLFGRLGPLASWEDELGIKIAFDVPGVMIATIFVTLPLMVREVMPVLRTVDREQEYAAATLGAGGWVRFWSIVFPVLRSSLLYGIVLTFARSLGEFGAVLVVGGSIQGLTETLPLYIFRALENRNPGAGYQLALLLALISLILVISLDRWKRAHQAIRASSI